MRLIRLPGSLPIGAGALSVAALILPGGTAGQQPPASTDVAVVGSVYDSAAARPLAGAAVYLLGTPHVTSTDSLGRFAFIDVGTGTHILSLRHPQLDSLGLAVPPQWQIDVTSGVNRVRLSVPSTATVAPELCQWTGAAARTGTLFGSVRDASTGTSLPEATVELVAGAFRDTVEADSQGRYVACGLPTSERILARVSFLRHAPSETWLELQPDRPLYRAFELRIARGAPVSGRLVDHETGRAVDGALVEVESAEGETMRVFTDPEGRFNLGRLDLETYLIRVEHLAYGKQTRWFTISDVEPVTLEVAVSQQPVELEGLTVTVRSEAAERLSRAGVRADLISREEIETMLGSARSIADLVRTIPGVRVRQDVDPGTGQPRVCIEPRRTQTPGCQSVLVVLDGIVSSPEYLQDIPPQMIRSIEFIPSILAGVRYGRRSGYGVLEVATMAAGG